MKKVFLASLMLMVVNALIAQTRFGIKAGTNFSNWVVKENGVKDDEYGSRTGYHFGLVVDQSLGKNLSFQPQLLFVNKGASIAHEDHTDNSKVNALDIPLNFLYRSTGKSGSFFAGGGPNLGFNLNGEIHSDEEGDTEIEFGSEAGQYKRFDFGINLLAGYELKNGLFLSANYTPGISNLKGNADITRSNYIGLSVGYFFGGKGTERK